MGYASEMNAIVVDEQFAAFGKDALYVAPAGGAPVPCVIMRDVRDQDAALDNGRPLVGQMTIEVRKSEIAAPAHGGVFTLVSGGLVLTVSNRPLQADPDGLMWRMWVEE